MAMGVNISWQHLIINFIIYIVQLNKEHYAIMWIYWAIGHPSSEQIDILSVLSYLLKKGENQVSYFSDLKISKNYFCNMLHIFENNMKKYLRIIMFSSHRFFTLFQYFYKIKH